MAILYRNPEIVSNQSRLVGYTVQTEDILKNIWHSPYPYTGLLRKISQLEDDNDDDYRRTPFVQIWQLTSVAFAERPDLAVPNQPKKMMLVRVSDTDDERVIFQSPQKLSRNVLSGESQRIIDFLGQTLSHKIGVSHLRQPEIQL